MDDEHEALDQWQLLCEEGVEDDADADDCDHHQGQVPGQSNIVGLIELNDALKLQRDQVRAACDVELPGKHAQPSCREGQ